MSTEERVTEYFLKRPSAMTLMAARDLGLPEAEVIRALPAAVELKASALEDILQALAALDGPCHVIVSNRGATLESRGAFGGFSRSGPFLNIETPTLDMHLRPEAVASAFSVSKPGHRDGKPIHTVQFYDAQGDSVMKVVLPREAGEKALEALKLLYCLR